MIAWIIVFLLLLLFGYISASVFSSQLRLWENAVLIVRSHIVNQDLKPLLKTIYKIHSLFSDLIVNLDRLPFFPSWLRIHWWDERMVYLFISLPIIIALTSLITLFHKQKWITIIGLALAVFWIIPVPKVTKNFFDSLVSKNHWDIKYPWSPSTVWIWDYQKDNNVSSYTSFRYQWNQKNTPSTAEIMISSLGDYQLIINGQSIYHGPSYGVYPFVYYDQIDLSKNIKIGENEIIVICNYSNVKHHRHITYPSPGLLVGGGIKDGLIVRNLADNRLWQVTPNYHWNNGPRISMDSGFSENFDLTDDSQVWKISQRLDYQEYILKPRPVPLLVEKDKENDQINSGIFDFKKTMVGYLIAQGYLDKDCTLSVSWGDKLDSNDQVQENSQNDTITFPKGEVNWEQFSRRSGRYLKVNKSDCENQLKIGFKIVQMPFIEPEYPNFPQEIDKNIYQLSIDTLKNNVQDHFEDSLVRERAMYIGDAREVSRCLMVDNNNSDLVREMIRQFSQSQNEDGSLPAMTPSGNQFIIYDYVFQWVVWLDDYISKTDDFSFAKEMWPSVEKIISWSDKNASPEGLLNNNWWVFIDWTPIDRSQQFITSLQVWHYQALKSAASIAQKIDQPYEKFNQKADQIKKKLIEYAFDKKNNLFTDSFSLKERSTGESLITNSLAGIAQIFPSQESEKKAVNKLINNLYTSDPFSESWVIEWLIKTDQEDMALETLRTYWGGMINDGATSIFEYYHPTQHLNPTSYSHAWGCGPIYLYKQILSSQN